MVNNKQFDDPEEMAERLNSYFSALIADPDTYFPTPSGFMDQKLPSVVLGT